MVWPSYLGSESVDGRSNFFKYVTPLGDLSGPHLSGTEGQSLQSKARSSVGGPPAPPSCSLEPQCSWGAEPARGLRPRSGICRGRDSSGSREMSRGNAHCRQPRPTQLHGTAAHCPLGDTRCNAHSPDPPTNRHNHPWGWGSAHQCMPGRRLQHRAPQGVRPRVPSQPGCGRCLLGTPSRDFPPAPLTSRAAKTMVVS